MGTSASGDNAINDATDEFSFLPGQAKALGASVPATARHRLTVADGRTISGIAFGDEKPQVVLLHGAGLNAHTWDTTVLSLALPTLAIDLPGHGDSSWRDDADYSPATIAIDVAQAMTEWADPPVVLVGQSLGGLTAAAIAAARPELLSRLVLVDITPSIGEAGPSELRRFYQRQEFSSREELVEYAVSFGLGGSVEQARRGVHLNSRVRADGVVEWKHHFARIAAESLPGGEGARIIDHTASWSDLDAVTTPITLIRSTEGFVDDATADAFRARLPQADVVTVAAPHNVQEAAPVELAGLIRSRSRGA